MSPSRSLQTVPALFLLALVVLPCFLTLGHPPLWDANEPLYAEPPKEVVSWPQGDFWAPTWNGHVYYAHPPLSTWITVPFYLWLGCTEAAERLPMALAAIATVFATFFLGRRLGGNVHGFLAALVLAATPRFWLYARQLAGDIDLVAILTAAFALVAPVLDGERRPVRTALACVLVGIGALAKGPVIFALFAIPLAVAWFVGRPRPPLRPGRILAWSALVLVLAAPWFVAMSLRFPAFLEEHFGRFTFQRVAGGLGERGPFFYVVALAGDAQPWILLLPIAGWRAWRRFRQGHRRGLAVLPWAGILAIFLLFTASLGKRNVYMLPIYPLMALALTPFLREVAAWGRTRATTAAGLLLAAVAFAGALGLWILQRRAPGVRPEVFLLLGALVLVGVAITGAALRGGGRAVLVAMLAGLWIVETTGALVLPALGRYRPVPSLARVIAAHEDPSDPEPAVIYRVAIHSLNFYLGRSTVVASNPEQVLEAAGDATRVFVLSRRDRARDLTSPQAATSASWTFEEIASGPYLTLQFRRVIAGRGRVTRDLVLLEGRRLPSSP